MIRTLTAWHRCVFDAVQASLQDWLPGLLARLVFAGVLLVYFLNSATRKLGEGFGGLFSVTDSAYFQILPGVMERYGYDVSQLPSLPWDLVVYLGTYSEVLLPLLIVAGLFTRLAALGMMVFVVVQSYVDIAFHGVEAETIGAWFDRFSDAVILDQRALWLLLLAVLVIRGAGKVSLDHLLRARGVGHRE